MGPANHCVDCHVSMPCSRAVCSVHICVGAEIRNSTIGCIVIFCAFKLLYSFNLLQKFPSSRKKLHLPSTQNHKLLAFPPKYSLLSHTHAISIYFWVQVSNHGLALVTDGICPVEGMLSVLASPAVHNLSHYLPYHRHLLTSARHRILSELLMLPPWRTTLRPRVQHLFTVPFVFRFRDIVKILCSQLYSYVKSHQIVHFT